MKTSSMLGALSLALTIVVIQSAGCGGDDDDDVAATDAGQDVTRDVAVDVVADVVRDTFVAEARSPEQTGSACQTPADCYYGLDSGALKGAVACIDRVTGGYCTHECTQDSDCCAVAGECRTTLKQVCASFTSTGKKFCFLSCEPAVLADAGIDAAADDGEQFCRTNTGPEFGCRSTGGGVDNRKACIPINVTDGGPLPDAADAGDATPDAPLDAPADG